MALTIVDDAPLDRLNTFAVRARAKRLVVLDDTRDTDEALAALAQSPRRLVLGGGSNVLFTRDFDGAVLQVRTTGRRVIEDDASTVLVEAAAGEGWDGFVRWTLSQGLCGLENLSLIPGTVGASPIQNIGAYGVEMCQRFEGLNAVRVDDGTRRNFTPEQCEFGYRDSAFRRAPGKAWLIERVRFRLSRTAAPSLDHGELREELSRSAASAPGAAEVADAVRALRRRKLPDPAVLGNAGSFFKNPVLPRAPADKLLDSHPGLPHWPAGDRVKLSAAWMIERCGWKGRREANAGVHASHALVLVNYGGATGAQILALAQRIRGSVLEAFGIELEPEPLIV